MRTRRETRKPTDRERVLLSGLRGALEEVPDRREASGRRHPLAAILTHVVVATLCNCQHRDAIAQWGRLQSRAVLRALGYTRNKSPCGATLFAVLRDLDVAALDAALRRWAASLASGEIDELRAIAIDGKTARGSGSADGPPVHVLTAFLVEAGIVLASAEVGPKTNEAKRAESFVGEIDLAGAVVTGDAAFAQKRLCRSICEAGGDFLLTVKDNQPVLREAIEVAFDPPDSPL